MKINIQDRGQWHKWFAWYPVRIGSQIHFLNNVVRRWDPTMGCALDSTGYGDYEGGWEYKQC